MKRGKNSKRYGFVLLAAALLVVCLAVPKPDDEETPIIQTQPAQTKPAQTQPSQVQPTVESTAEPAQPTETTAPPVLTGWVEKDGRKYYYRSDGTAAVGWQQIDGNRCYFRQRLSFAWIYFFSAK